jgi:predicted ArsR family transcriptional regulator
VPDFVKLTTVRVRVGRSVVSQATSGQGGQAAEIDSVAALADPVRRSLYRLVVAAEPADVSRDDAAARLRVRRGLAAFHLDKLVEAGLLETDYRRPAGVGGPGAGRPTKYYRRSRRQIDVSLPRRRYELMGGFLAGAVASATAGVGPASAAARSYGRQLGELARGRSGAHPTEGRLVQCALDVLEQHGFEPAPEEDRIVLRNCPFHLLATSYTETVCEVNHALHRGLVEGLGTEALRAERVEPEGRCCVAYRTRAPL